MSQETWSAVDRYISDSLIGNDPHLEAALADSAAAALPNIAVSPGEGKFLHLLVRITGAKKVLEIGTLGGYSTIWMAKALPPDGKLITLEAMEKHAQVATRNIARAGLSKQVELRLGSACETLPTLIKENAGPFDLIFIDADKVSICDYVNWALKLSRKGTVLVVDNVVRTGKVIDAASSDASVQGVRKMYEMFAKDSRISATALQTVGAKGYDGFAIAIVN